MSNILIRDENGIAKYLKVSGTGTEADPHTLEVSVEGGVGSALYDTSTAISGVVTVTTAGTAVQGPNVPLTNGVYIKALSTMTGKGYVGNDGADDVSSTTGYELEGGGAPIVVHVDNLNEVWFDTSVNDEKFCWIKA